jgi:hypothetical protein
VVQKPQAERLVERQELNEKEEIGTALNVWKWTAKIWEGDSEIRDRSEINRSCPRNSSLSITTLDLFVSAFKR